MATQFRILGPVETVVDGARVELGAPKQRALLALLLVNRRRVVPAEQLIDGLWGEQPPASALQFESLLETMFALANDGKTNRKGMPNPFRLAVIAKAHHDTVVVPFPPVWLQKAGLALGAPLGRLLGYAASYTPAPVSLDAVPEAA